MHYAMAQSSACDGASPGTQFAPFGLDLGRHLPQLPLELFFLLLSPLAAGPWSG